MDDSNADVMTFGLISADRWNARPGDIVKMSGSLFTANGIWAVDKVEFNLRRSEVALITCGRIVDPIPKPPTGTVSGLVTNGTQTGGATAGLPGLGG